MRRAAIALLPCLYLLGAAGEDPVIAQRGSDQITLSQARALIAGADAAIRRRLATEPAMLEQFLRDALLQRALLAEATAAKWEQGSAVAALLQRTHDQVVLQTYLASRAKLPQGYPTASDIEAAYEANTSRFMQPRSYHLVQIFLPKSQIANPDEGRRKLLPLRAAALRAHADLQDIAGKHPNVQFIDSGWLGEQTLAPAIRTAIEDLPDGAMSDPICTENGCHLLRRLATRPAELAPLAAVRDTIVQMLRNAKQQQLETAYANALLAREPIAMNQIQMSQLTQ
jgi:parvulin-like peptidyl-prolyl isomerase